MAVVIPEQLLDRGDRLLEAEPDEHLVGLAQSGHDAAFAAIVRRYEPELLSQARRLSADGRGEDAVQQVFLNAFAALQAGAEVRHLRGWLHQILRNVVIRAREPADAPLEAATAYGEPLEDTVHRRAQLHATLAELSALPERQRDALLGTAVMGFPRAQVAQRMGLSEGAVRQLVHRARLRLRQAATALVPFPLGRFFGGGGTTGSEAALGAGAAASGGVAVKVGALLASGVVATGLAVTQSLPGQHHRAGAAPASRHHTTPAHGIRRLLDAPAVPAARAGAASAGAAAALVVHARATARDGSPSSKLSGGLHDSGESHHGPPPGHGRGDGHGRGGSHGSGARGGEGPEGSGGSGHGQDGGTRGSPSGGGGGGPTDDRGGPRGSGTPSESSGSTTSLGSGADASGSGRDGGGSGDGTSASTSGSDPTTVTTEVGDVMSSGGSDGSSTGVQASGSGSDGTSTSSQSSGSGSDGSRSGSGTSGDQKDSGGSRDVSGSAGSSSS